MPSAQTLSITVDQNTLTLRRPRRQARTAELPGIPDDQEFIDGIDSLALSAAPLSLESDRDVRLRKHLDESGGPDEVAKLVGQGLFDLLFSDGRFLENYHAARDDDNDMRLVLEFVMDQDSEQSVVADWAALPWEYLWDSKTEDYLALRPNTHLIRRLSAGATVRKFTVRAPLKVLGLLAEPWNQQNYERVEARRALENALSPEQGAVILEPRPTFPDMVRALSDHQPHVLHLVAHGGFRAERGGTLALEDQYGDTHSVSAQDFASQVAGSNVRLVVLNSCLSGSGEGAVAFQGVAQALMRAGVPAVVAMQYSVPVVTANRFSEQLYRSLSGGNPLDEAVSTARRVLHADPELTDHSWAMPTLYMNSGQWALAQKTSQATEAATPPPRRVPSNLGSITHRANRFVGRANEMIKLARALRMPPTTLPFRQPHGHGWHRQNDSGPRERVLALGARVFSRWRVLGLGQGRSVSRVAQQPGNSDRHSGIRSVRIGATGSGYSVPAARPSAVAGYGRRGRYQR